MRVQFITLGDGMRLAVLPENEYLALIEAQEDHEDREAVRAFNRAVARGEEEMIPAEFVERILDGENKVRVWREYRGLTAKALAEATGIAPAYLSQIETGVREGKIGIYKKLARALRLDIDDLV